MTFIQIHELTRTYRTIDGDRVRSEQIVFEGLSLDIHEGEFVAVIGPNGCGKSTLLNMIGGLDTVDKRVTGLVRNDNRRQDRQVVLVEGSGRIRIDGFEISSARGNEKADFINHNIGFVFQFHHLIPELTVLDNVALPMMIRGERRSKSRNSAMALLRKVEMEQHASKQPTILSGGEKQRVAIARALINQPRLLLADEPTGSLDPELKDSVFDVFRELNRSEGLTVVLVTHDRSLLEDKDGRPKVDRVVPLMEARKTKVPSKPREEGGPTLATAAGEGNSRLA